MRKSIYITKSGTAKNNTFTKTNVSRQFSITNKKAIINANKMDLNGSTNLSMDYESAPGKKIDTILKKLHESFGLIDKPGMSGMKGWNYSVKYYNRFKQPVMSDILAHGHPHVFFVRPNCNILSGGELTDSYANNSKMQFIKNQNKKTLRELVLKNGSDHDFMLSLSNKAKSFSLNDVYISSETYGKGTQGYGITIAKSIVEAYAASTFNVTFSEDRYMHVLQLINAWMNHAADYHYGSVAARPEDVVNKILEYAGACYYFVTSEDYESIIYWAKYYGVFPIQLPMSHLSYAQGTPISNPDIDVTFAYSFRKELDPMIMAEFNYNARLYNGDTPKILNLFDSTMGSSPNTWVGKPFIELIDDNSEAGCPYMFKLRYDTP